MVCLKRYCKQQDLAQWPSLQSLLMLLDPDRERCPSALFRLYMLHESRSLHSASATPRAIPPCQPSAAAIPLAVQSSGDGCSFPSVVPMSSANEISRRWLWSSATHHKRCRMCGAPTHAAGISATPQAYPKRSRSARTAENHSRPSLPATCSPKTVGGRHSAIRW